MKNLVIVESPSKSKTIEKYLGKDYIVTSSKGHICDLATKGKDGLGVDVDHNFETTYAISKDKKDTVKQLKTLASKANEVYLATDPDREGEAISWHLANELGLDVDTVQRVEFHEITKNAVLEAFKQPRKIDMDLVRSQETRRILDRIIGFKLSKLLNNKIKSKSAGRVQSVALKLIVDREKEISAFTPEEYWTLHAHFVASKKKFVADLSKFNNKKVEIKNEQQVNEIIDACQGPFTVANIEHKEKYNSPKPPFITSTLQQEASTKLGFSAKKTMTLAQKLYEGVTIRGEQTGLITYMRTDSYRLSDQFMAQAKQAITERYGKEYCGYYVTKKNEQAQDAHEAIRPTHIDFIPEDIKSELSNDEYKLYSFIYYRALAALMAKSKFHNVTATLSNNGYDFVANGHRMIFDGYTKAYNYESNKDEQLPEMEVGQTLSAQSLEPKQHFTEPKPRYTEASLIKALEEYGIGRPSTYATIIDTIQARDYVELKKSSEGSRTKVFFPTEQGTLTTSKLDEFFSSMINVKYTANMETELDEIAEGKLDNIQSLREFWTMFEPLVQEAYEKMEKAELEEVGESCPDCGNPLVYRKGRFGKFISCSTYPTCTYTRNLQPVKTEEPTKLDENCPECGKQLTIRAGRYGKFIACSDYPTCNYHRAMNKAAAEKPELTDKVCPKCGSFLYKRKSRYGTYFYGCSKFPKCRYIEKDDSAKASKGKKGN